MEYTDFYKKCIDYQIAKHSNNPYWQTEEQVVENMGGVEAINGLYSLACCVSEEQRIKVLGF